MIASLAFTGMILVTSGGLFGALGFYGSVKEGERIRPPSVTPHAVSNISHVRSISNG